MDGLVCLVKGRNFGNQTVPRSDCLTVGEQAQFLFSRKNLHFVLLLLHFASLPLRYMQAYDAKNKTAAATVSLRLQNVNIMSVGNPRICKLTGAKSRFRVLELPFL
jgi:hypothetical protein